MAVWEKVRESTPINFIISFITSITTVVNRTSNITLSFLAISLLEREVTLQSKIDLEEA